MPDFKRINVHFLTKKYIKKARNLLIRSDDVNAISVLFVPRHEFATTDIPGFDYLIGRCREFAGADFHRISGCVFVGTLGSADGEQVRDALRNALTPWENDRNTHMYTVYLKPSDEP